MAVHQYRFGLLPRGPLIAKYGKLPKAVIAEDFAEAWMQQPSCDVMCLIDAFATRYPSWSNDVLMWGSGNNGNRIHVVYEDGRIIDIEVSCRIAAPREHQNFAAGIISLAKRCDWLLVLTDETLAEPNLELLLVAIYAV